MSNENPILSSGPFNAPGRRDRRFRRQMAQAIAIKARAGEINPDQEERFLEGLEDPYVVRRLRCRCEYIAGGGDVASENWWSGLLDWLLANWPQILQILMGLLMFLGDDEG